MKDLRKVKSTAAAARSRRAGNKVDECTGLGLSCRLPPAWPAVHNVFVSAEQHSTAQRSATQQSTLMRCIKRKGSDQRALTHGAAEHDHHVEQGAKGMVVAGDVGEHDLGQPLALQALGEGQEGG